MLAELRPEPRDTISSISFSPNHAKNVLAATSWDNVSLVECAGFSSFAMLKHQRQLIWSPRIKVLALTCLLLQSLPLAVLVIHWAQTPLAVFMLNCF